MMNDEKKIIAEAMQAFLDGEGMKAEALYLKACEIGSGHAVHNLGILYATGAPGVEADAEKSQYWLSVSLDSGFEDTVASNPEWFKRNT